MKALNRLPVRVHGGPDEHGVPLYDFSTNSNACGPCPIALQAVVRADAATYPDASYTALRTELAAFHKVDANRFVLAASASEFIFRITALARQRGALAVWLPAHSYGDYAQAAQAHRLAVVAAPGAAQLLWACEPSSPLGVAQQGLTATIDGLAAGAITVLDHAYEPLRLAGSGSLSQAQASKVWQVCTPNKALGLTGIRAAYAIAPLCAEADIEAINQLCPSWPIGAHGVAMLQAWVQGETQAWLAESLQVLRGWKANQVEMCESLGWVCQPSQANFFCARPALPRGQVLSDLLAALRVQGIKMRDTSSFGLPGQVRVSVQKPDAQNELHRAWTAITQGNQ